MRLPKFDPTWTDEIKQIYNYDVKEFFARPGDPRMQPDYYYRYQNRFKAIVDRVQSYLTPGSKIVDLAAAQGNFSLFLAERGYNITWNDLRAGVAEYVRLKYECGNLEYLPGNLLDVRDLAYLGKYDAVIATEILEHVAHPNKFLCSLALFLRPGGFLFLSTPNGKYFRNRLPKFSNYNTPGDFEAVQFQPDGDGHIFLLHPDEIINLAAEAGLELCEFSIISNPLTAGQMKSKYITRFLPEEVILKLERMTQRLPQTLKERFLTSMICVLRKPDRS